VAFCAVGLADSLYLTFFEANAIASCGPSASLGCASVLASSYSRLLGMPISLLAAIWFLVMAWNQALRQPSYWLTVLLSALGLLAIAYLIYVELFLLGAFCAYCTLGHISGLGAILAGLHRALIEQAG